MSCCVVLSPVVLWCVEVYGVLWCVMWCVCSFSVRAGGVLFKTRTQYRGVLGKKIERSAPKWAQNLEYKKSKRLVGQGGGLYIRL